MNNTQRVKRFKFTQLIIDQCIKSSQIFFTDEKYFSLNNKGNPQVERIWTTPETRKKIREGDGEAIDLLTREVDPFSPKVMVAGGISYYGVSKLIFFVGNCNSECYEECLKYYKEDISRLSREGNIIHKLYYQQDRASSHTSDYTADRIKEIFSEEEILPVEWPPKGIYLLNYCNLFNNYFLTDL
jgi:hypothetical protein